MRSPWVVAVAVLAFAVIVAYAVRGDVDWVFDDHRFVEMNPALDEIDVAAYFTDPSTTSAGAAIQHDIYRPLRTLDYAMDTAVFGRRDAGPFRVKNVLLHLVVSLLVFRLAWGMVGPGRWAAALVAAALFAVHPVAVESVAWISSRGDLLAVAGMLGALIVLERPGLLRTLLGVALALAACFAKESALVLPFLLPLRDLALPRDRRPPLRTTLLRTALLGVVVAAALAVRAAVIGELAQTASFPGGSRAAAARGMLAGLVWYAKAIVFPRGFAFDVHLPVPGRWSDPVVVLGAGLLVTLLLAGARGVGRRTTLAFAAWGALACLVPVSNVLVPLKALVAERFLYPALFCVAVGVAGLGARLRGGAAVLGLAVAALAAAALLPATRHRVAAFADDRALWEAVLHDRPGHMRAYEGLAFEYLEEGRIKDAELAYRSYLLYNPADAKSMVLLADALGRVAEALRQARPQPGVVIGGEGRRLARTRQLELYRMALDTWARVGLGPGRGSPDLLRHVHAARIRAAHDLGDYGEVKRANDAWLLLDGFDPADAERVLADAPFARRRVRLNLALSVLLEPRRRDLEGELRRRYLAERAAYLRDVGIAPALAREEALSRLLGPYRRLAAEPEAGAEEALNLAKILDELGRRQEAADVRRGVAARWPDLPLPRSDR